MPGLDLQREALYTQAFKVATDLIKSNFGPPFADLNTGTSVFRYGQMKFGDHFDGALRIHRPVTDDKENRWSGIGANAEISTNKQGLYFAMEASGASHTIFSELFHYQKGLVDSESDRHGHIEYFSYNEGGVLKTVPEGYACFYQYRFETTKPLLVFKIPIPLTNEDETFFAKVYRGVKKLTGSSIREGETARSLYLDPKYCSFARAIGNACLNCENVDGFIVDSTRDERIDKPSFEVSKSLILKGDQGDGPNGSTYFKKLMDFRGRASFFVTSDATTGELNVKMATETLADIAFNTEYLFPDEFTDIYADKSQQSFSASNPVARIR